MAVVEHIPDVAARVVDHQPALREEAVRRLIAPGGVVRLGQHRAAPLVALEQQLVGHLPGRDHAVIARGQLLHAPDIRPPHRVRIGGLQPGGLPRIIGDAVRLRLDAVLLAELKAQIGRGAAIDLRRILREARLALLRLQIAPVERQRRQIERALEVLAVHLAALFLLEFVQHEQIRAVLEVVRLLRQADMCVRDGFAVLVSDGNLHPALAVVLDAGADPVVHVIAVLVEYAGHFLAACAHSSFPPLDGRCKMMRAPSPCVYFNTGFTARASSILRYCETMLRSVSRRY